MQVDCDGLVYDTITGELTISGVSMHTPAWCCMDLTPLWLGGDLRGSDRLIPGVAGVKPYRRRFTSTKHSLPMVLLGRVDRHGAREPDEWIGLQRNITWLRQNVLDPTNTGDGTRVASLRLPDGTVRSAHVTALGVTVGTRVGARWLATLDFTVPAGVFA